MIVLSEYSTEIGQQRIQTGFQSGTGRNLKPSYYGLKGSIYRESSPPGRREPADQSRQYRWCGNGRGTKLACIAREMVVGGRWLPYLPTGCFHSVANDYATTYCQQGSRAGSQGSCSARRFVIYLPTYRPMHEL